MEKPATDIYTFENLRKGQYTYVDKTAILKELADDSRGRQFFIARPRRFGKSLAVTTLQALFEGKRELFKGLAIEPQWDWSRKWPVLRLDMGSAQTDSLAELKRKWREMLANECARHNIPFRDDDIPSIAFERTINDLAATSANGQVVLLLDEYDKPLIGRLGTPAVTEFKNALKAFYSVIKTCEGKQRFAFITGVSKFSKVSIFSDLNNLDDMTLDAEVATLFGFTHDEVRKYYPDKLAELGKAIGKSADGAFAEIVKWYDGYKFHPKAEPVFNPVSLGMTFKKNELGNWWSLTAKPTFLVDFFRTHPVDVSSLDVSDIDMNAFEPEKIKPVTLLYQTGYLTIRGAERRGADVVYKLGFPNAEVENSFLGELAAPYSGNENRDTKGLVFRISDTLRARDPEGFVEAFKSFFGEIPYDLTDRQNEQSWQAIMYVVMRLIGLNVGGEVKTNKGRIDLTVETATDAYVIEVKRDSTPMKAISQIREQGYVDKFRLSGKPITLIGIAFSTKKRAVSGVKIVREADAVEI
ncbi:MAG: AAA family ATPase [Kiritimatiellae bacterium]|nr:AAA family ATPase [Kiritimatiellia bacterium]